MTLLLAALRSPGSLEEHGRRNQDRYSEKTCTCDRSAEESSRRLRRVGSVPSSRSVDVQQFGRNTDRPGEPRKPSHSAHAGKGRFKMARLSRFQARAGYDALQPERARTDRTADSPAQAQLAGHSHALHPDSDAGCSGRYG
jgi:hypothetical protein